VEVIAVSSRAAQQPQIEAVFVLIHLSTLLQAQEIKAFNSLYCPGETWKERNHSLCGSARQANVTVVS
jgi:hypothetical protein